MFFIIKYHFEGMFEKRKYHVCLGNYQTTGLNNFVSYPVKTLHIHVGKWYLLTNSGGTDVSSESGCFLSWPSLLAFSLHFAVELVMCPLWLG